MAKLRYPAPQTWRFNDEDREAYGDRYWRCPSRLVHVRGWAKFWRMPGTTRGGGAMTCLLPVLALHTWPEKEDATPGWTGWAYLSRRRMATLAGINKDTATQAITQLKTRGLLELERRPRAKYEGGYKTYYRLATSLYPWEGEPYATIQGNLIYGGTWAVLPSSACRHLYVVLACLDPIGNEEAYLEGIAASIDAEWERLSDEDEQAIDDEGEREAAITARLLAERRQSAVVSLKELEDYTGFQRSTVIEALQVLTVPIFGNRTSQGTPSLSIPLIRKGRVRPGTPTWYAPDRRAWTWFWHSDFLNTPARVEAHRQQLWPHLTRHQQQTPRRVHPPRRQRR